MQKRNRTSEKTMMWACGFWHIPNDEERPESARQKMEYGAKNMDKIGGQCVIRKELTKHKFEEVKR